MKIGGGPAQLMLTPVAPAVMHGGTLRAHELEVRRGTSTASDRLAQGAPHVVPDLSYFASYRNLRRRPRQFQALRKVFTVMNRVLWPAREIKWSLVPPEDALRQMMLYRDHWSFALQCFSLWVAPSIFPANRLHSCWAFVLQTEWLHALPGLFSFHGS